MAERKVHVGSVHTAVAAAHAGVRAGVVPQGVPLPPFSRYRHRQPSAGSLRRAASKSPDPSPRRTENRPTPPPRRRPAADDGAGRQRHGTPADRQLRPAPPGSRGCRAAASRGQRPPSSPRRLLLSAPAAALSAASRSSPATPTTSAPSARSASRTLVMRGATTRPGRPQHSNGVPLHQCDGVVDRARTADNGDPTAWCERHLIIFEHHHGMKAAKLRASACVQVTSRSSRTVPLAGAGTQPLSSKNPGTPPPHYDSGDVRIQRRLIQRRQLSAECQPRGSPESSTPGQASPRPGQHGTDAPRQSEATKP